MPRNKSPLKATEDTKTLKLEKQENSSAYESEIHDNIGYSEIYIKTHQFFFSSDTLQAELIALVRSILRIPKYSA